MCVCVCVFVLLFYKQHKKTLYVSGLLDYIIVTDR